MAASTYTNILNSLKIEDRSDFGEYFISAESERMKEICSEISKDGIMTDYTILSVVPVTKWFIGRAKAIHDISNAGLKDKNITPFIMDAAYYMGESFVRSTHSLSWKTDTKENILPRVTGFKFSICMCPLTDTYGMFEDILVNKQSMEEVERTILMWLIKI